MRTNQGMGQEDDVEIARLEHENTQLRYMLGSSSRTAVWSPENCPLGIIILSKRDNTAWLPLASSMLCSRARQSRGLPACCPDC